MALIFIFLMISDVEHFFMSFVYISWPLVYLFWKYVPGDPDGNEPACQCRRCKRHGFDALGQEHSLEEDMATCSSILAWRIPRTEKPGGLQSTGSQRADTT